MSVPFASTKTGNRVSFVVKHTFIEVQGGDGEDTSPRRRSDVGPIRTAPTLECMSGLQTPSTCDDDDSEEKDFSDSAMRKVSFVSSVDSDDFIGSPSLIMSTEWSSARTEEIGSTCHAIDTKADIAWAPCSSSDSTISSASQTPWAPCWSSDSTLSSGSQLPWAPCSSAGSNCSLGNLAPSLLSARDTLQQTRQCNIRMSPDPEEEPRFVAHDTAGDESRTTVMVRNLPTNLCQLDFVKQLNQRGYKGLFDFVYMPMNLRGMGSFGYAFVNFTSASVAVQFTTQLQYLEHDENEWRGVWSTCQGMEANVERYRNSPLMHKSVPADCKPVLYDRRGIQMQFPAPTKTIPKPRIHHTKGKAMEKDSECMQMARDPVGWQSTCGVESQSPPGKGRVWPSMSQMSANAAAHMVGHLSRVANPR